MLNIFEFGSQLIETEDLDPVYVALWNAQLPGSQLRRIILAYSCLYHLGAAAKISEKTGTRYWDLLYEAAENVGLKWPRGGERRHFRGRAATEAVVDLRAKYRNPEFAVENWFEADTPATTFTSLSGRVREETLFGPWIAFKLADIAESLGWPVDFSNCELGIFKDPRQGAALYRFGDWKSSITDRELKEVISELVARFSGRFRAPPRFERKINVQEVESILCKWKSHYKGHYWVGKDIYEIRRHLVGWGKTAELLLEKMPKEVARET